MTSQPKPNDPTPDELAERTAEIRATWTPAEEAKRRGVKLTELHAHDYEIPQGVRSHK